MLLHFKKSNKILETWSPHRKNLAFQDPPSLNFHNRTDANVYSVKTCYQLNLGGNNNRMSLSQAEREFHRRHDNLVTLAQCFKANIGPHFAIRKAIGQEKKYDEDLTTWQKFKIWFIISLASIPPFTLYTLDVSTDSALVENIIRSQMVHVSRHVKA